MHHPLECLDQILWHFVTVIESFGQPGDKSRFPEVFTCPCFEQFSEPVAELSGTAERLDLDRSPLRAIFARPEPICGDYPLLVGKEFLCVAAAIAATVGVNLAHGAGRGYNARCREDRQSVGASWFDCQSNLIVRPSLPGRFDLEGAIFMDLDRSHALASLKEIEKVMEGYIA